MIVLLILAVAFVATALLLCAFALGARADRIHEAHAPRTEDRPAVRQERAS